MAGGTVEGVVGEGAGVMSHIIFSKHDSYDLDNYTDAYRYLIIECPNGLGSIGLMALNTLWRELHKGGRSDV